MLVRLRDDGECAFEFLDSPMRPTTSGGGYNQWLKKCLLTKAFSHKSVEAKQTLWFKSLPQQQQKRESKSFLFRGVNQTSADASLSWPNTKESLALKLGIKTLEQKNWVDRNRNYSG